MKTENYITPDDLIALDIEWSTFLNNTPEQLGWSIKHGNEIFAKEVKRWCVKMSLKYKIPVSAIKERYGKN